MELRDVIINFCAHIQQNYHPVEDFSTADMTPTTSELVSEIEQHFGELGSEESPFDRTLLVDQLTEMGFKYLMLPGTMELRWLLATKK